MMRAGPVNEILLLLLAFALTSCEPAGWPEGCGEKQVGRMDCESGTLPVGTWVIRSRADYDALNEECEFSTRYYAAPPVPGHGEMLLIARLRTGGCDQCLMPVCASNSGDTIVAEFTSAQSGWCSPVVLFGYWMLVPASDQPVQFEGIDFPEIPDGEPLPCEDHPLLPPIEP